MLIWLLQAQEIIGEPWTPPLQEDSGDTSSCRGPLVPNKPLLPDFVEDGDAQQGDGLLNKQKDVRNALKQVGHTRSKYYLQCNHA